MADKPLTPEEKLELVRGMRETDNVAEYARQRGIDRTYLYQLAKESDEGALELWSQKTVGRPARETADGGTLARENHKLKKEAKRAKKEAKKWQVQALATGLILEFLDEIGAVKKTSSGTTLPFKNSKSG